MPSKFTDSYQQDYSESEVIDLRYLILSKGNKPKPDQRPYSQVFEEKTGFICNLSAIDLLFNLGPKHGLSYLKEVSISVPF